MELLKYLDVLIGFAIVMVFLSPMVSAITQAILWIRCARANRLQVALKNLLLQLEGNTYQQYEAITVTGYAAGQNVTVRAGGLPEIAATADASGVVRFDKNIPELLKAGNGDVTLAQPANAVAVMTAVASGPVGGWRIQSVPTDVDGQTMVHYEFPGAAAFASPKASVTLPAGALLDAEIASGPYSGKKLTVEPGPVVIYPDSIHPVPSSHDLKLTLRDVHGAPMAGGVVTLAFERNAGFDATLPLAARQAMTEAQADGIAREALLHPMVGQPTFYWLKGKFFENRQRGEVVEREEFIRILLEFAAGEGSGGRNLLADTRAALQAVLRDNGITNPAAALSKIRDLAQQFEKDNPSERASARLTKAMLIGTPSDFLGKMTTWFDPMMFRTSAEYKFRAQLVTVFGALLVAVVVQVDSFDLLKRLSAGDSLRASLVNEAQEEEKRIDAQASAQNKDADQLQQAQERLQEVENNLARLRDPQMSALPQRFLWQPSIVAQLNDDAAWLTVPYPKHLDLLVGGNSYALEPVWRGDPLHALKTALDGSGAPVDSTVLENAEITFAGDDLGSFQVKVDGVEQVEGDRPVARVRLVGQVKPADKLFLRAGYYRAQEFQADTPGKLADAIQATKLPLMADANGTVTAKDPNIYWIELRRNTADGENVFGPPKFLVQTAHMKLDALKNGKVCMVNGATVACAADKIAGAAEQQHFSAKVHDLLKLETRRDPPLELRGGHEGEAAVNLLTPLPGGSWGPDWAALQRSAVGIVVTWMLLSLGAPFWYDALKDLLKLRSGLAKNEEDARKDRVSDAPAPKKTS